MLQSRPFRFGVVGLGAHSRAEWVTLARKAEGLGYAVFVMPDHFQPQLAPMTALMAVADATHVLRIGSFVFANDFRHPAVLAMDALSWVSVLAGQRQITPPRACRFIHRERAFAVSAKPSKSSRACSAPNWLPSSATITRSQS